MWQARDASPMTISELNKYYTACVERMEIHELVLLHLAASYSEHWTFILDKINCTISHGIMFCSHLCWYQVDNHIFYGNKTLLMQQAIQTYTCSGPENT